MPGDEYFEDNRKDGTLISTKTHGDIQTWLEATFRSVVAFTEHEVWGASGTASDGRVVRAFGSDKTEAIVKLLDELSVIAEAAKKNEEDPDPAVARTGRLTRVLRQAFWTHVRDGDKIRAIRDLREDTYLNLRDAKEIVDRLSNARPVLATTDPRFMRAGTVIRIKGSVHDPSPYGGYVFEKDRTDDAGWLTPGFGVYTHDLVEEAMRTDGYDVLYVPEED